MFSTGYDSSDCKGRRGEGKDRAVMAFESLGRGSARGLVQP